MGEVVLQGIIGGGVPPGSSNPDPISGSQCLGRPLRGEREHLALIALARLIS